eukprot:1948975-Rhodomonas_salina.5
MRGRPDCLPCVQFCRGTLSGRQHRDHNEWQECGTDRNMGARGGSIRTQGRKKLCISATRRSKLCPADQHSVSVHLFSHWKGLEWWNLGLQGGVRQKSSTRWEYGADGDMDAASTSRHGHVGAAVAGRLPSSLDHLLLVLLICISAMVL